MMYFKDRSQPKMYRILIEIENYCNTWLSGDSLPTLSVYAEGFVLAFSLIKPLFACYLKY